MDQLIPQIQSFFLWVGGIAAGTAIGWFLLPHIAGHIYLNILLLLGLTVALAFYSLKIQPTIDQLTPILQYFGQGYYQVVPQVYAQEFMDMFYVWLSVEIFIHTLHAKKNTH